MKANLDSIILYVQNVDRLKTFYETTFDCVVLEETPGQWALLKAGYTTLGLHKIGKAYESKEAFKFDSNSKLVFTIEEDLSGVRTQLIEQGVAMREIKTFDNYEYWLCDGEDPEGNVFQLRKKK